MDMIVDMLKDNVKTLVEDINGNHAIQKVLFTFLAPTNEFIFENMINQCKEIACHKHGCCVMQKCIAGANQDQKDRLIDEIINNTQAFVRNPYGNYVVQYVIDLKDFDINTRIGEQLLGSLIELGNQKFSSNVIEKCLEFNHREIKNQMVKEMLTAKSYLNFLTDQYGNYVIQKTLGVAEKDDLEQLIIKIKPDMEALKKHSDFGVKIYNKLVKTYPTLQSKTAKANKNNKKSSGKNNKGAKRKGQTENSSLLENMMAKPVAASYMQASAGHAHIMVPPPPPPVTSSHGYQHYSDFPMQNMSSSYFGYNNMNSNQFFMYHNEGGNMGYPGTSTQPSMPSHPNLHSHSGYED